jgi:hypothetical protein
MDETQPTTQDRLDLLSLPPEIREQAYLQILNEKDHLLISYKHQMT